MRDRVGESILNNKIERREAFLRKALAEDPDRYQKYKAFAEAMDLGAF